MFTETRGIVLRQTKTVNGRRMILLFTEKYGKISVGAPVQDRGKGKNSLAFSPFTYGSYDLYHTKDYYNLNKAQVIKSFYAIGEDVDKYIAASYGLELAGKLLEEGVPDSDIFTLTVDFLGVMERRKNSFDTVLLAFKVKLLKCLGLFPQIKDCVNCGTRDNLAFFNVKDGGVMCSSCVNTYDAHDSQSLIYKVDFDILNILNYFVDNPITMFEKLALQEEKSSLINQMIDEYIKYHLDLGKLKTESCLTR